MSPLLPRKVGSGPSNDYLKRAFEEICDEEDHFSSESILPPREFGSITAHRSNSSSGTEKDHGLPSSKTAFGKTPTALASVAVPVHALSSPSDIKPQTQVCRNDHLAELGHKRAAADRAVAELQKQYEAAIEKQLLARKAEEEAKKWQEYHADIADFKQSVKMHYQQFPKLSRFSRNEISANAVWLDFGTRLENSLRVKLSAVKPETCKRNIVLGAQRLRWAKADIEEFKKWAKQTAKLSTDLHKRLEALLDKYDTNAGKTPSPIPQPESNLPMVHCPRPGEPNANSNEVAIVKEEVVDEEDHSDLSSELSDADLWAALLGSPKGF
ncbi:hypothetical protein MMC25_000567 [Agyrium rufum]|nr:hypothetical protein [Agyrium rufum]